MMPTTNRTTNKPLQSSSHPHMMHLPTFAKPTVNALTCSRVMCTLALLANIKPEKLACEGTTMMMKDIPSDCEIESGRAAETKILSLK